MPDSLELGHKSLQIWVHHIGQYWPQNLLQALQKVWIKTCFKTIFYICMSRVTWWQPTPPCQASSCPCLASSLPGTWTAPRRSSRCLMAKWGLYRPPRKVCGLLFYCCLFLLVKTLVLYLYNGRLVPCFAGFNHTCKWFEIQFTCFLVIMLCHFFL